MANDAVKAAITRDRILVDLALQGGGSHGAFTWGVLDRLLEALAVVCTENLNPTIMVMKSAKDGA